MTPRAVVRRNQARAVLADLRRDGKSITLRTVEHQAVARYAGELHRRFIDQVVAAAAEIEGLAPPPPPPPPARPTVTSDRMKAIVTEGLRRDPQARSSELMVDVLLEGELPIAEDSFRQVVHRARLRLRRQIGLPRAQPGFRPWCIRRTPKSLPLRQA